MYLLNCKRLPLSFLKLHPFNTKTFWTNAIIVINGGSVTGIPFSTTDERLTEVFSQFGEVVEGMLSTWSYKLSTYMSILKINKLWSGAFSFAAQIVKKRNINRSKGYGFVTFATESDAQKALKEMNGQVNMHFSV